MGTATDSSTQTFRGAIEVLDGRNITRVSHQDTRFWISATEGPRRFVPFTAVIAGLERTVWIEQNAADRAYAFVEVTIEAVLTNDKVAIYRLVSLSPTRHASVFSGDSAEVERTLYDILERLGMIRRP